MSVFTYSDLWLWTCGRFPAWPWWRLLSSSLLIVNAIMGKMLEHEDELRANVTPPP